MEKPSADPVPFRRDDLKTILDRRVFRPNSTLFRLGDHSGDAFILLSGDVEITRGTEVATVHLADIQVGQMFG